MSETNKFEIAEAIAAEQKARIQFSLPSRLLLDLDNGLPPHWDAYMDHLRRYYGPVSVETYASKSGGAHMHVIITLDRAVPFRERIALQAAGGSDWRREVLSLVRIALSEAQASLLFKPTGGAK